MRANTRYTIADTQYPSEDRGTDFTPGDAVEIRVRMYFFPCPQIQNLFDQFANIRKHVSGDAQEKHSLPFSAAWKIQEEKYNRWNWDETYGYYAVGIRDRSLYNHWQIGWVGGLISTYPLLAEGLALSHQRALRTFDFVFPNGQDHSGFFFGCGKEGQWFCDHFDDHSKPWLLIRKNSDALYFLIKQFMLLHQQDPAWKLPAHWAQGTRRCANAFVSMWDRFGQFGQFVDSSTGDIIVGGSTSASTAPAGLA